ncbi:phospho-sugar glycosidase domain-containing protein [Clostridium sp. DL-VIII]|uniref:phospho-sugar glycosidase domain-containing protein n=1 Tax=Clostridium sp. DL-VIII TaxID=641107 RepID=UPI001FA77D91|nr:phospho-sugar glycosidase domain-containing protein [Clostridium sp. DL-VIII]
MCFLTLHICNEEYMRYMGELQILKTNQKADHRTNVVARVAENYVHMLKYIDGGKKFYFNIK